MKCPSCKTQYRYRFQAVMANKGIGLFTGEYFNVYHCLWCGDWHLASRKGRVRNNKKKILNKMKKTILSIAILFILSSCDVFNPTMKFKVSGSGQMSITYSDSEGTISGTY